MARQPAKPTLLTCGLCRRQGKRFATSHDAAGDRRMDKHFDTTHPRRNP